MKILDLSGQNCYLSCIINITATLVPNFEFAFSNLWGEFDFFDNQKYNFFTSKRIYKSFENLGIKITHLDCSTPKDFQKNLATIADEKYFFIGMDGFHVPWDPTFHAMHGDHYFVAKKPPTAVQPATNHDGSPTLICFDTTYNIPNQTLDVDYATKHAFDLCTVEIAEPNATLYSKTLLLNQVEEIVKTHNSTKNKLLNMQKTAVNDHQTAVFLAKQITAMTNNRKLFAYFIRPTHPHLFDFDFIQRWLSLKHGTTLFSFSHNPTLLPTLNKSLSDLLTDELAIAKQLLED